MQANNEPKWTDDAAFWDEAWADMHQRLEAEDKSRRKSPIVWWQRPAWLLAGLTLLLAVTAPAVVGYYFQEEISAPAVSPPETPAKAAEAEVFAAEQPALSPSAANVAGGQTSTAKTTSNAPAVSAQKQRKSVTIAKTRPVQPLRQKENRPTLVPTSGTSDVQSWASAPDAVPPPETVVATEIIPSREDVMPTVLLPITALTALPNRAASPAFPQATLPKRKGSLSYGPEAGVTSGLLGAPAGYYAGVHASVPLGKRLSMPLSVRFRRDYLETTNYPSGRQDLATNTPVTGSPTASDTIYLAFNSSSLQNISISGVEGRLGLAYRLGARWQVSTSLAATRILTAKSSFTQNYLTETAGAGFDLAADFSFTENFEAYRISSAVTNNYVTTSGDAAPVFNQWMLRAELGIAFRLKPGLQLVASGGQLLQQPDKNKILGVQRGRVEVGMKLRLR